MLRSEVSLFLIVGLITVAIDLFFYSMLVSQGMSVSTAKAIGFVMGALFAYFANKYWTFSAKGGWGQFIGFLVLYGSTFVTNVGVNAALFHFLANIDSAFFIAFLVATGSSATLNFLGMKLLIFLPNYVKR